jgi:rieske iron-sulfur protein
MYYYFTFSQLIRLTIPFGGIVVGRRAVLKGGIGFGIGLGLGSPSFGQEDPAAARPKPGDLLIKEGDPAKKPLGLQDIPIGAAQTMAWAMDPTDKTVRNGSRLNRILLLRFDEDKLAPETKSRAAGGVVAYTAICTHEGCEVDDWVPNDQYLYCPCHSSMFDPKDGAKVRDGPAPRGLPALPIKLIEGNLVVAQPFTARVGFEPG